MQLEEILDKLSAWFPPEDHKERKIPGGGRWLYVPHQEITKRLNEVCAGYWHTKVTSINVSGDYTVVMLELTICNVTRVGIGDDKTFPELNDEGKAKIIGTPPVRAFRNAFKDACEQFGICGYLDEQSSNKQAFIKYMQSKGDLRAYKYAQENEWKEVGAMGNPKSLNKGVKKPVTNDVRSHPLQSHPLQSHTEEPTKPPAQDLYPANNLVVKQVRSITRHNPDWIYAQCRRHGYDRPGMMPPDALEKLICDMCADWAVTTKVIANTEGGYNSIQGAISFARNSGQSLTTAALSWLERHKPTVAN